MVAKNFARRTPFVQIDGGWSYCVTYSARTKQTSKITRAGFLVALATIFSLLSHFVSFPLFSLWLKFEYISFIFLLAVHLVGIGYTTIIYSVVLLLRLTYDYQPVGILALWLAYTAWCWTYWGVCRAGARYLWSCQWLVVGVTMAVLATTVLMVGVNYGFLIKLYAAYYGIPVRYLVPVLKEFLIATTAFNLVKFGFNGLVFGWLWRLNRRLYCW